MFVQDAFHNYITEQDHVYIFLIHKSHDFVQIDKKIYIVWAHIMDSGIWPRQCGVEVDYGVVVRIRFE